MFCEIFPWTKTFVALLRNFENCRKHCEGKHESARNWHVNHMGIQLQVSNYKKFKLEIARPLDRPPISDK